MAAAISSFKKELKIEEFGLEDERMDVSEQLEEGEISDDDVLEIPTLPETGLHEGQSDNAQSEVTRRFDLVGDLSLAVPKDELSTLYTSLGIDEENERHYIFNTVHMRGCGKMNTKDVYEYFSGLKPAAIKWLEEGCCNIEWDDEILPARALLYLSVEIKNLDKRFKIETMEEELSDYESDSDLTLTSDTVDAFKLNFYIPPGKWRKGVSSDQSKEILVRYANKDDNKAIVEARERKHKRRHSSKHSKKLKHKEIHIEEPHKNPWGDLAMTWGRGEGVERIKFFAAPPRNIPDLRSSLNDTIESRFVDNFLLKAVERRRALPPALAFSSSESGESSEEEEEDSSSRRRKLPKMHADREEERQKIKKIAYQTGDLRERLNLRKRVIAPHGYREKSKPIKYDYNRALEGDSGDDLSSDWATENYRDFHRTVASREREDTEESGSELELGDDEPGELLQIEIDNDRYQEKKDRKH